MTQDVHIRLQLQRPSFALDANLQLPGRGISVLFGPSGCGKTTLLRCVAGLEQATLSHVSVDGAVWEDSASGLRLPTWQRQLGYVFQEASLFDHLNVEGNVRYGLRRVGQSPEAARALEQAVTLLDIGSLLERRPHQLSGGERQRVAIARALATDPQLLLMDEPLAALDAARKREVLPWLERLRDELHIPMLYVTHAVDEAARLANAVVLMQAGQAHTVTSAAQLLAGVGSNAVSPDDISALIEGQVRAVDAAWQLAEVAFDAGRLWLRQGSLAPGQPVRVRVYARDVSIATEQPHHTSIQNLLPCTVHSLQDDSANMQCLVHLQCGASTLLARVTARSVHSLGLQPGLPVWAQLKSVALVD